MRKIRVGVEELGKYQNFHYNFAITVTDRLQDT